MFFTDSITDIKCCNDMQQINNEFITAHKYVHKQTDINKICEVDIIEETKWWHYKNEVFISRGYSGQTSFVFAKTGFKT